MLALELDGVIAVESYQALGWGGLCLDWSDQEQWGQNREDQESTLPIVFGKTKVIGDFTHIPFDSERVMFGLCELLPHVVALCRL